MSRSIFLVSIALMPALLAAQSKPDCSALPDAARLRAAVQSVVKEGASKNGGLGNQEWAVTVNRDGIVCAVVFSGASRSDEWPGSRVIAASKANTANGLSGNDYALSTANVFAASQPGQSLYSLATSAPPNANAVFGDPTSFGTDNDHIIAWKVRHALHLDVVPMGPSSDHNDNMILDFHDNVSASGFGHPSCKGGMTPDAIIHSLSKQFPTGPPHM
jgi:hypothetical protein